MIRKRHVSRQELKAAIKVLNVLADYVNDIITEYLYDRSAVPRYYSIAASALREAEALARDTLGGQFAEEELEILED